tara:strand:- start:311 stop:487 length:177 start_codon:yes stop_codon:yes gene_type:complete
MSNTKVFADQDLSTHIACLHEALNQATNIMDALQLENERLSEVLSQVKNMEAGVKFAA